MVWGILLWLGVGALLVVGFMVVQLLHLSYVLKWEDRQTRGTAYYGLSPEGRARFKKQLRRHARLLYPIVHLAGRFSKFSFDRVSFRYREVAAPRDACTEDTFAKAEAYQPRAEDVFVVTQMKCGTTWMQHVVYEVLQRGQGDIVGSGATLYAVSPWLEALRSVSLEAAPLIGQERPSRVIKTHLPVQLCPYSRDARYIYVARHPVSCFASCTDFIATNAGPFAPELPQVEEWFCSPERMWWGTWTMHVQGWWARACSESNVLFLFFEDMKRDLPSVVHRVADFLGIQPLSDTEVERILEKTGFAYMQRHKDAFEMNPPHILQTDAELFVRGSTDRHRDVPEAVRDRLRAWCAREMRAHDFPLAAAYPDVVESVMNQSS